ncbi:MAG: shikimate kinase AroK [Proteobacteria bacterium]|nr:shikimate kinase AroK [Pseudomonadota bacterium]
MSQQNIFLIGLMAVGKSTVGRLLANCLQMPFYDSDHVIEERAGASVAWIFDVEGEVAFRDREEQVIDELTSMSGIVMATGGGAVLRSTNRVALGSRGIVIHLDSPLQRLIERTEKDKKRPLLRQGNPREALVKLQAERAPLYSEIADYRFITDQQGPKVLAAEIHRQLSADGVVD